ncbi:OLC1v1031622C1 [Oldenlandia corymbosa var. corymbosa]|uniref:OLC1v1031622C1 n=1 Tax=Oldenlandia corymbosa var. corymbosa TaxID=529605 RepID=A0AAV1CKQ7_OLDCO|nr:OLC1v1031622C1 [Oldenlandia corymbosa var. corymbosa]
MADHQTTGYLIRRFSQQFNAAFIKVKFCIFYFFQRDQQINLPGPDLLPHAAFAFAIFLILGFLQLKYQGKEKSPFESHPTAMSVAVISLLLYCFANGIEQRLSSNACRSRRGRIPRWACDALRWGMLLTASLSVATTATFLMPASVRPLFLAFYLMMVVGERVHWIYRRFVRDESNWWRKLRGSAGRQQVFFTNNNDLWRNIARYFSRTDQQRSILPQ